MEGWVDLGYPAMHRPGVELAIFRSLVQRPTTTPPSQPDSQNVNLSRDKSASCWIPSAPQPNNRITDVIILSIIFHRLLLRNYFRRLLVLIFILLVSAPFHQLTRDRLNSSSYLCFWVTECYYTERIVSLLVLVTSWKVIQDPWKNPVRLRKFGMRDILDRRGRSNNLLFGPLFKKNFTIDWF